MSEQGTGDPVSCSVYIDEFTDPGNSVYATVFSRSIKSLLYILVPFSIMKMRARCQ